MPLPWPEIRDKAIAFQREWQDAERMVFLFEQYQKYTSLLPNQSKASNPKWKRKSL